MGSFFSYSIPQRKKSKNWSQKACFFYIIQGKINWAQPQFLYTQLICECGIRVRPAMKTVFVQLKVSVKFMIWKWSEREISLSLVIANTSHIYCWRLLGNVLYTLLRCEDYLLCGLIGKKCQHLILLFIGD